LSLAIPKGTSGVSARQHCCAAPVRIFTGSAAAR
jgi:hypothetical protein